MNLTTKKFTHLERAEMWDIECPYTGAHYRVQFWDTHQEDRWGKRRMCVAIWQQNPTFPSEWGLALHSRHFYPPYVHACDGEHAARAACAFLPFDDMSPTDELIVTYVGDL